MKIEKIHNCKVAHHLKNLYHYQALGWRKENYHAIFLYNSTNHFATKKELYYNVYVCFNYIGGMFTANTMSSAVETLGMTLPGHYVL